jgi:hypothetical protein
VPVGPADAAAAATAVPGAVTAHGRRVVFSSAAANLVPDDTNGVSDVFAREIDQPARVKESFAPTPGR